MQLAMDRNEAITRLREHEAELKALGVQHLYLFGSTARDEAGSKSDVDLFFDHERGKLGLFALMDVKERADGIVTLTPLGRRQVQDSDAGDITSCVGHTSPGARR